MGIDSVSTEEDPLWFYGTGATSVMAFYEALAVGQGALAAAFVVPEKREDGPLSGRR